MVDSFSTWSDEPENMAYRSHFYSAIAAPNQDWNFGFVIVLILMACAMILAPDSPEELASICERHNPTIACEVW